MSSEQGLVYYESSWAILSTIGISNLLHGIVLVGITGKLSPLTIILIMVSAAIAIANGLCYYTYYADYPLHSRVVAACFADFFWLVQEAGLPFYSFFILRPILRDRRRQIFLAFFWTGTISTVGFRAGIITCRIRFILSQTDTLQPLINKLHFGYFSSIALSEITGAFFLLRILSEARRTTRQLSSAGSLFSYLMRSTEMRIALLALLGIARCVTYSFQVELQAAIDTANQLDRLVYTLQCMFPIMLMIDILASRIANKDKASDGHHSGAQRGETRGYHINSSARRGGAINAGHTPQVVGDEEQDVDMDHIGVWGHGVGTGGNASERNGGRKPTSTESMRLSTGSSTNPIVTQTTHYMADGDTSISK